MRESCKTLIAVVFDYTLQDRKTSSEVSHVNEVAEQVLSSHEMVRLEKIKIEPLHKTIITKITLNFNEQVQ